MSTEIRFEPDPSGPWDRLPVSSSSSGGGYGNLSGSGSPEGVETADVGTLYWDYTNDIMYVKDTGTGSTGWIVFVGL